MQLSWAVADKIRLASYKVTLTFFFLGWNLMNYVIDRLYTKKDTSSFDLIVIFSNRFSN